MGLELGPFSPHDVILVNRMSLAMIQRGLRGSETLLRMLDGEARLGQEIDGD